MCFYGQILNSLFKIFNRPFQIFIFYLKLAFTSYLFLEYNFLLYFKIIILRCFSIIYYLINLSLICSYITLFIPNRYVFVASLSLFFFFSSQASSKVQYFFSFTKEHAFGFVDLFYECLFLISFISIYLYGFIHSTFLLIIYLFFVVIAH